VVVPDLSLESQFCSFWDGDLSWDMNFRGKDNTYSSDGVHVGTVVAANRWVFRWELSMSEMLSSPGLRLKSVDCDVQFEYTN
jgi:hypothetical protein